MSKVAGVGGSIFIMAMTAAYFSHNHPRNYFTYQRRSLESGNLVSESPPNLTNTPFPEPSSVLVQKLKKITLKEGENEFKEGFKEASNAEVNNQAVSSTEREESLDIEKHELNKKPSGSAITETNSEKNASYKTTDKSNLTIKFETSSAISEENLYTSTTVESMNTTEANNDLNEELQVVDNSVEVESDKENDTSIFSDDDLYNATDEPFVNEGLSSATVQSETDDENIQSSQQTDDKNNQLFTKIDQGKLKNTVGHVIIIQEVEIELPKSMNLSEVRDVETKKAVVKQMMRHAWESYVRFAWGKNELKPLSKKGHTGGIFGSQPLGATILDGLDTLYIMGMNDEFKQAKDWVINEFDVDQVVADISVFEVNIRFVAGLLSCFALTGETVFREKARQIADKLLPAFNTPTGIPHALVNFKTGASRNYGWASSSSSILSEFGTLHMEFGYLSDVTGKSLYRNKVDKIRHVLQETEKPNGLYPNYLNPRTGKWGQHHISMGALGDSFYEYLLKVWLQTNKEDGEAREMFDESMQAIFKHMLFTSPGGLTYFAERKFDRTEHKMDHLACFSGGLLGLASMTLKNEASQKYMDVAKQVTNTCHEAYDRSYTKLGPESFRFTDANMSYQEIEDIQDTVLRNFELGLEGAEARGLKSNEKYYILRPEVIEAYFYMWRLTKDEKYREWAWEAAQAIEKYCRTPSGYSGIKNVYSEEPIHDDVQQSFFLAETLKYLYLIFSDDSLLSLDEWVFNTEAHPFPIKGINPYYREAA